MKGPQLVGLGVAPAGAHPPADGPKEGRPEAARPKEGLPTVGRPKVAPPTGGPGPPMEDSGLAH